jgi:hypothetical protein
MAQRKKVKGKVGGWRPGAGRPREVQDPVRLAIDFERPDTEALSDLAAERSESVAATLRRIVHGYLKRSGRL